MWRLYFLIGTFALATSAQPAGMFKLSGGKLATNTIDQRMRRMLTFAVAGFAAPDDAKLVTTKASRTPSRR